MTSPAFPPDDYTPHGYLDNPYDAGPWALLEAGGPIRSLDGCGFGWYLQGAGLRVGLEQNRKRLLTGQSYDEAGIRLISRYHTSRIQTFDFSLHGAEISLTFLLAGRDALLCRAMTGDLTASLILIAQGIIQRMPRRNARTIYMAETDTLALMAEPGPWFALRSSRVSEQQFVHDDDILVPVPQHVIGEAYSTEAGTLTGELSLHPDPGPNGNGEVWIALGRGESPTAAAERAGAALATAPDRLRSRSDEDERFWRRAPRLAGDWPASWRRGWVYDLETTRLMLRPPAGVFRESWPTWRLFQPRVVLAENSLDMLRLACADPETAQAAILSAFRHAPRPNLPCLFSNGSLNMVAEGGDACGTSPAWCLPFHNIYMLYLWYPDRDWLSALYPLLESYLDWWILHRADQDGWIGYRCTWEAGEDGSLRLDPSGTGHGDILGKVRPVELQAAVSHSALLLKRLGEEVGIDDQRQERWRAVSQAYAERTRSMWDDGAQRFLDQYPGGVPPVQERATYWDQPADRSALQLIPLLYGVASPDQSASLRSQLSGFNRPPWTSWASWSYVVVEAARELGAYQVAGRVARDILSTVYPRVDRHHEAELGARPGTSHEWWPADLSRLTAQNETYGWGATTSLLLLRHIFGFGPSQDTQSVTFELAPSIPGDLRTKGHVFGCSNLHFRGARFNLELEVEAEDVLRARLTSGSVKSVAVAGAGGPVDVAKEGESAAFRIRNNARFEVTIG